MTGVATAIAASAVVGGAVANKSAGDALDAQEDQNAANQAFIREQAAQAREDAVPLFDSAQRNREIGAQGAFDTQGLSTRQQIDTTGRGNYFAQEALLGGQQQVQNAILGLPTDMGGMQARLLHPERNLEGMFNTQVPEFERSQVSESVNDPVVFQAGQTTNQALATKAFEEGHLTQQQFGALSRNFAADPDNAAATNWGGAQSLDGLLGKIGANTNPLLAGALSTLFHAVHTTDRVPQGPKVNQEQLLGGV